MDKWVNFLGCCGLWLMVGLLSKVYLDVILPMGGSVVYEGVLIFFLVVTIIFTAFGFIEAIRIGKEESIGAGTYLTAAISFLVMASMIVNGVLRQDFVISNYNHPPTWADEANLYLFLAHTGLGIFFLIVAILKRIFRFCCKPILLAT